MSEQPCICTREEEEVERCCAPCRARWTHCPNACPSVQDCGDCRNPSFRLGEMERRFEMEQETKELDFCDVP